MGAEGNSRSHAVDTTQQLFRVTESFPVIEQDLDSADAFLAEEKIALFDCKIFRKQKRHKSPPEIGFRERHRVRGGQVLRGFQRSLESERLIRCRGLQFPDQGSITAFEMPHSGAEVRIEQVAQNPYVIDLRGG